MSSTERQPELDRLASSLDERDHATLGALLEHKVLTTPQLKALFFRSIRRCQQRLRELTHLELICSFQPPQTFARGRSPEHHLLTDLGLSALAKRRRIPRGQLPWIPDLSYEENQNLQHRAGVNAFFCSLVEASLQHDGHCLHRWRPEGKVRTRAGEIQPDGFGRYLHPGGACEFYLEYDRGTEGPTALADKLHRYLRFAAGWGEGATFPNLLFLVPTRRREVDVARAWDQAIRGSGRQQGPVCLFTTNEGLLATRGTLGAVWLVPGAEEDRLSLTELPAADASVYETGTCLGRYWTDGGSAAWGRISPASRVPRFPPGSPRGRS